MMSCFIHLVLLLLVLFSKHPMHVLNVFDSMAKGINFGHLLVLGCCRDVATQHLEPAVDLLDPISLAGVSASDFSGHRGRYRVS